MSEFFFDNKIYHKIRYFELGIVFSLLIIGFVFMWFENGQKERLILGLVLFFIGNGIAISWIISSQYIIKIDTTKTTKGNDRNE